MNTNRIKSLIRYDWVTNRQKLNLTVGLIVIIYACLALLTYFSKGVYFGEVNPELPTILAQFIQGYFSYAQFAMEIVITTILHHKFTNPRSSTSYLTMPGTSLEKWTVMLLEYVMGAVTVFGLYILCHVATMFVGWILAPELHWLVNPLEDTMDKVNNYLIAINGQSWNDIVTGVENVEGMTGEAIKSILDTVELMAYFTLIINIFSYLVYICLNMCFRTNGQIKSIAIIFGGTFVFTVIAIVSMILTFAGIAEGADVDPTMAADSISSTMMTLVYIWRFLIYASPLFCVGLGYLFYRQISRKQAK